MRLRFCALFAVLATALVVASPAAAADTPFTVVGSVSDPSGTTIPFFTSSFTYHGTTYPYSMVGSNPFTSDATTTVPTEVTPVRFVFADGTVFDAGTVVRSAVRSPIWQAASFVSGNTQYGDAIQRAEFWSVIRHGYHVRLGQPTVLPTVTIDVPANQGTVEPAGATFGDHVALKTIGLVNISWFLGRYGHLINAEHVSARTLPIILTHDVLLDSKTPDNGCCVGGFHSAVSTTSGNGSKNVQTAIFADDGSERAIRRISTNSNVFAEDINALSHEVSEWMNDPFGSNVVPTWESALAPQYGCSKALETGDPLVGINFTVNGYHPQDEAFLSWFAHETPSIGYRGRYSFLGTFTSPSTLC